MFKYLLIVTILYLSFQTHSWAQDAHDHHAKHNMIVFGETQVFASHVVYKSPHNYQVILALTLNPADRDAYLSARRSNAADEFIYQLDALDIRDIATQQSISGSLFSVDSAGNRHEIVAHLTFANESFKVLYFDELPLSLE